MRKRSRRVGLEVRRAIEEAAKEYRLRGETPNAADIYRTLEKDPDLKSNLPTERTIRAIASEEGPDKSGVWRATASSVDASLVLPTLVAFIEEHAGARTQFSVREAEAIAAICEAVPNTPPLFAWALASRYLDAEHVRDARAIAALDALLAFAPWTSVAAQQRYMKALAEGRVRQMMSWPDPPDATPLSEVKWKTVIPAKARGGRTQKGHKK